MVEIGNTFTETTRQGWGSRIGESIKGILVGLVLFVISFVVLFWNEGRAVNRARDLAEGQSICIAIAADRIDAANEGKLVHVTGEAKSEETLRDALFEIEEKAIRLRREVEMYQWDEDVRTETKKNVGGSEDTVRTYSYELKWSEKFIDSSQFKMPQGHENPPVMPFTSMDLDATAVSLGAFKLSPALIGSISAWKPLSIDAERFATLKMPGNLPARPQDGGIFIGNDPAKLEVGDFRVRFSVVPDTVISLISQQHGESFTPYVTKRGGQVEELALGDKTKEQMFVAAIQANNMMTWLLRLGGFLLMLIGLSIMGKPLSVLADVLPIAGSIVGVGVGIFAFVASLALSLITIAIAWIFYRPMLGIPLLVVGIALLLLLRRKGKPAAAPAQ